MARTSIGFGILLIIVGLVGFFATASTGLHPTALIPAIFGILLLILGIVGQNEARRKHAMHAAAALALLGFFGCVPGAVKFIQWQTTHVVPKRPAAAIDQAITAVICIVFVVLCIKSFTDARRSRDAA